MSAIKLPYYYGCLIQLFISTSTLQTLSLIYRQTKAFTSKFTHLLCRKLWNFKYILYRTSAYKDLCFLSFTFFYNNDIWNILLTLQRQPCWYSFRNPFFCLGERVGHSWTKWHRDTKGLSPRTRPKIFNISSEKTWLERKILKRRKKS